MSPHETLSAQQEEAKPKQSWLRKTLKFAGLGYILGDGSMYLAAALRRQPGSSNLGKKIGAVSWGVGGVGAFYYGNPDAKKQLELRAGDLEQFFRKRGIAITPDMRAQSDLLRKHGLLHDADRFLHRHPSQILNTGYAIGAGTALMDGVKELQNGRDLLPKSFSKEHLANYTPSIWIGLFVMIGAIGGLFIKEDPDAPEKAKNGNFIDKTVAWFKEKPLRFSAINYGLNNIPLALTVWQDFRNRVAGQPFFKQAYVYSGMQLAVYLVSNVLLALSGREQVTKESFTPANMAKLEEAAAVVIVAQPREKQDELLHDTSMLLAKQQGVSLDAATIRAHLQERIEKLHTTPEAESSPEAKWAAREQARPELQSQHAM